ncbi:GNAT family N-acetyltransferase [Nocardia sp. NPDC004068]|uniref:GNAT family N-acetyltransferase n=1 Tax=Nocardia sp. NPDC004068 TaxID=3364303 RepID=UPI0036AEB0D0
MEITQVLRSARRRDCFENPPTYRQAAFGDLPAIARIEHEVFDEPYRYLMLRQLFDLHGSAWVVCELNGTIIGYALSLEKDRRALLFTFAMSPEFRHRGYAKALLEEALDRSRRLGAEVEYLTVRPDNETAVRLFEAAGFIRTKEDESYFGEGEPRYLYELPLGRP